MPEGSTSNTPFLYEAIHNQHLPTPKADKEGGRGMTLLTDMIYIKSSVGDLICDTLFTLHINARRQMSPML